MVPWTVAHQAPLSMGSSREEYCRGLSRTPPGDLPDLGIEPTSLMSLALAGGSFITNTTWKNHISSPPRTYSVCWGMQQEVPYNNTEDKTLVTIRYVYISAYISRSILIFVKLFKLIARVYYHGVVAQW